MWSSYRLSIQKAITERKERITFPMKGIVLTVSIGTLLYIAFAAWVSTDAYHFVEERGAITILSAFFLATACVSAMATTVVLWRAGQENVWVWVLLTFGFGFLFFDELNQFHEFVGVILDASTGSGIFRTWNDIIVILYGVIALPVGFALLPRLIPFRGVISLFAAGFLFYVLHTGIDSTFEPPTNLSVILEESAKVSAVMCLAVGSFLGFAGTIWNIIVPTPSR